VSFQPILPMSGFGGWAFLDRTLERQQQVFSRAPAMTRDTDYFLAEIGKVDTANDLVSDRRLLRVALGAFGLDADIDSRAFLKRVLEDGTDERTALSNRLADKRYRELSEAFGFGDLAGPRTGEEGFGDRIVSAFRERQFEIAVGEQSSEMRLALGLRRDLAALAERPSSDSALWFTVMGTPPLRSVFETAYSLPKGFGTLDLDQQLGILRDRTQRNFGSSDLAQFTDPERVEALVKRFLLMSEIQNSQMPQFSGASAALQLLQAARPF